MEDLGGCNVPSLSGNVWVKGIDDAQRHIRFSLKPNPDHPHISIMPVNAEGKKMGEYCIYPYLKHSQLRWEITISCELGKEKVLLDLPDNDYDYLHDMMCKIHETSKYLSSAVQTKQ